MFRTMREGFGPRQEAGSARNRVVKLDGASAVVVPQTPDRSVINSVHYDSAGKLAAALDELAAVYDEAGVRAWTVWVPETDTEAQRILAAAGHKLDAAPMAMGVELEDLPRPPGPEPQWSGEWDLAAAGLINDRAYGDPDGLWESALGELPEASGHLYLTCLKGEPAAMVMFGDHEGDAGFWFAATVPEARGRGLVTGLLYRALRDARERGCATSTTQATAMGQPIYRRVGYRDLCAVQMWERRRED